MSGAYDRLAAMRVGTGSLAGVLILLSLAGCVGVAPFPDAPELVGPLTREEIEAAVPDWVEAEILADPDREAALALGSARPGAEVTVFLGTWCSDSRRELSRFWRALDEVGGLAPFSLRYVGVDRDKAEPAALLEGIGLLYVPTFIVRRDGLELGRIVEESPNGVERDLLALLGGEAEGLISAREDLQPLPVAGDGGS